MRHTMEARGVLGPEAVGAQFPLQRPAPPADLACVIQHHWLVAWDLRGRPDHTTEVLPHPSVHLVLEPGGGAVHGVGRERFTRRLTGAGWAVGTKFHPGGVHPFPVGAHGGALERRCAALPRPEQALGSVQAMLRARLTPAAAQDPGLRLARTLTDAMLRARPGTRVSEIAAAHDVSIRTVQRLFTTYVGVGPKWVLQRYRLHEALAQLHAGADTDWASVALGLGYYDQAHFIRDF